MQPNKQTKKITFSASQTSYLSYFPFLLSLLWNIDNHIYVSPICVVTSCWQRAFFFLFFSQAPRQRIRSAQAGPVSEPGESAQIAAPGGEGMNKAEGPERKLNGLLLGFVALCRPPFQWEDNFFSKCRSKNSINDWLVNSQELSAGKEEICSAAAASSCKRARE